MKPTITLGAYGWRHAHWLNTFYPEDLPRAGDEDWRLSYYSNQFDTVLVPADYWQLKPEQLKQGQAELVVDCQQWLHDVPADFRFFIECNAKLLERVAVNANDFVAALKILKPQLSALVITQTLTESALPLLARLQQTLAVPVFGNKQIVAGQITRGEIWQPQLSDGSQDKRSLLDIEMEVEVEANSPVALFQDALTDLRAVRAETEKFSCQLSSQQASILVLHRQLQTADLLRFRTLLDIMGF